MAGRIVSLHCGASRLPVETGAGRRTRPSTSASRLALIALLGSGASASLPAAARDFPVSNASDLANALNNAANGDTITFKSKSNITLGSNLPALTKSVTINGNGSVISGAGLFRGLIVSSGTVTLNNLSIVNTVAQGGNGANSFYLGGGAGLGGGFWFWQGRT